MITLLDVPLPITAFILFSLLTIPTIKVIRRRKSRKTALELCWFLAVFIVSSITVANIALKYYTEPSPKPFLNISLIRGSSAIFSSMFLVDAVSVYMAIIFTGVGAVTTLYSLFSIGSTEELSERYFAVMLMIIGCVIGTALAGDLLTLFIFGKQPRLAQAS